MARDRTKVDANETCGRCGAQIPGGLENCPQCGALLAAYRSADQSAFAVKPPAPRPAPPVAAPTASAPVVVPPAAPSAIEPDPVPVPDVARPGLEAMLWAEEAPPVEVPATAVEELHDDAERADEPEPPSVSPPPVEPPRSIAPPPPPRVAPPPPSFRAAPMTPPAVPRRPGFVVKGSLAVALITGVALFIGACVMSLVASAAGSDGFAGVGFCLSGAGVITVVVALLVAAARREGPRI